jgi:hypothetical protein
MLERSWYSGRKHYTQESSIKRAGGKKDNRNRAVAEKKQIVTNNKCVNKQKN